MEFHLQLLSAELEPVLIIGLSHPLVFPDCDQHQATLAGERKGQSRSLFGSPRWKRQGARQYKRICGNSGKKRKCDHWVTPTPLDIPSIH